MDLIGRRVVGRAQAIPAEEGPPVHRFERAPLGEPSPRATDRDACARPGQARKHILFLTHYFPPEVNAPASRTYEHCREWCRLGHRVTVVTCAPNHPNGRLYPGYRNRLFQQSEEDGIQVIRVWAYLTANQGVVRRTLSYLSYFASAILASPFLPRSDVVISTSPQFFCGLAGYFVSRLKRARWVLEIRDLWPESIITVDAIRNRRAIRMLEALEQWAYRKADLIVVVTRSFVRHVAACGIPREKIAVVMNGVDLTLFGPPPADVVAVRRSLGVEGRFLIAYFGTLGMAHRLETVLEAAELLRDEAGITFLIAGGGAARADLVRMQADKRLENVVILDQQPKERMPSLWAACDASLVLLRKSPLFATVIPSKIFEAMAMARPIILGVEGETCELVTAAGCGMPFEPENAAALASAARQLAGDPAGARAMGERGRRWVKEHGDRTRLARAFAKLVQDLPR